MHLSDIDSEIHKCNLCNNMVEKFPNSKTVSVGKRNDIVILGEAPATMVGEKAVLRVMIQIISYYLQVQCFKNY